MKNKTWIWVSLGISVVGVGGYFLYKVIKQRSDLKKFQSAESSVTLSSTSSSSVGGGGSSSGGSSTGSNPFGSKEELKNFQSWVNTNKGGTLKVDGAWGPKSSQAFATYGTEYKAALVPLANTGTPSGNDFVALKSVMNNFEKPVNTSAKLQIATSYNQPRILIDFYKDGLMVVQKDKAWTPVYDKLSGKWFTNNGTVNLAFGTKTYALTNGNINVVFDLLKENGYLNPQNSQFVPFDGQGSKSKNRRMKRLRADIDILHNGNDMLM
jgi:hypothetical protein